MAPRKPTLAVWKFASCDGCQLSLLDLEDELLALAGAVDIAYFREATSHAAPGPYDLSLVEGSVTTAHDVDRIAAIRRDSRRLVTIGACATAGGIQALRNGADIDDYNRAVYPRPEFIRALATSTPIAAHVPVDYELRGCPVDKHQLLEVVSALIAGRRPSVTSESVCAECKRRGTPCVAVAGAVACLGPVTHAGCGAICPAYRRGCYGCFGPAESATPATMAAMSRTLAHQGLDARAIVRLLRTFNAAAPAFHDESQRHDGPKDRG